MALDHDMGDGPSVADFKYAVKRAHIRFAVAAYPLDVLVKLIEQAQPPTSPFILEDWYKGKNGEGCMTLEGFSAAIACEKPENWEEDIEMVAALVEGLELSGKCPRKLITTLETWRSSLPSTFPERCLTNMTRAGHWTKTRNSTTGSSYLKNLKGFGYYPEVQASYLQYPEELGRSLESKGVGNFTWKGMKEETPDRKRKV